ncbi:hypothetical protein Hanom_Chr13g01216801 [Helianthus anomalus]
MLNFWHCYFPPNSPTKVLALIPNSPTKVLALIVPTKTHRAATGGFRGNSKIGK